MLWCFSINCWFVYGKYRGFTWTVILVERFFSYESLASMAHLPAYLSVSKNCKLNCCTCKNCVIRVWSWTYSKTTLEHAKTLVPNSTLWTSETCNRQGHFRCLWKNQFFFCCLSSRAVQTRIRNNRIYIMSVRKIHLYMHVHMCFALCNKASTKQ